MENEAKWEYYRAIDIIKRIKTEETHERYVDRHKAFDLAIQALEKVQEYEKIGTVEECRVAVERMKPKKVKGKSATHDGFVANCPSCNKFIRYIKNQFMCDCGQSLDWQ